jgi:serine/threonine protein phosphatase PrpC
MPDDRESPTPFLANGVTPHDPAAARRRSSLESLADHVVHSTPWARLEAAVASAPGKRRRTNEDWHSPLDGRAPLFVVADGVGGGAMAARASRELVAHMHAALEDRRIDADAIRGALLAADREVGRSIAHHTQASGAATVALCVGQGRALARWLIGWVGDCRVYRIGVASDAPAELLTVDDTYRALREVPPPGGSTDDPARMVGNGAVLDPNVKAIVLGRGEMLALCSDGVHKHVGADDLARVLRGSAPLARRCWRVVALARARGSTDDATVLVVQRERRPPLFASLALGLLAFAGAIAALAAALMVMQ